MDRLDKNQEEELTRWLASEEFDQYFVKKTPSKQMDKRFFELLNRQRRPITRRKSWMWIFRLALPMVAIAIAFFIGRNWSIGEDASEIEMDFATELMNTEKVGDKINLVSNTKIQDATDEKVIEALLFSLNNDESVNVRLACINTLYDYTYLPKVRTGLIQAISNQQSPIVLANLAQAINASGKKLTKEEFMALIDQNLPPPIKSSIDASLIKI